MTVDYAFIVCPDCGGHGLTINPEVPLYRDHVCPTCRGVGVVDSVRRPLSGADFWFALTVMVVSLPFTFGRDLWGFGPSYAWTMARVHYGEIRTAWRGWRDERINATEIHEAAEEWLKRSRLRLPDEGESK